MNRAERLALALDSLGPSLWTPLASLGALLSAGIPSQLTSSGPPWWLLARYEVQVTNASYWQPRAPLGAHLGATTTESTNGALNSRLAWFDAPGSVITQERARVVASAQRPSRPDETNPLPKSSGAWVCDHETVSDYCTATLDTSAVHRVGDPEGSNSTVVVPGLLVIGLALAAHADDLPRLITGLRARFLRPVFADELLRSSASLVPDHGVQVRVVGLDGRTRAIAQLLTA